MSGPCEPTAAAGDAVLAVARRVCPAARSLRVVRVSEGVSTEVYRVVTDGPTLYLRLLPEEDARVPEVVYFEECEPLLQRSVMVTREVAGTPLVGGSPVGELASVLAAAGRDLTVINSVSVQGFGWVRRVAGSHEALRAEHLTYEEWALVGLDRSIASLQGAGVLSRSDAAALQRAVTAGADWATPSVASLAHGDFDGSHIYHDRGAYSGIIDFGEIRGAEPTYDLGQFQIEHPAWLPLLLAGYREAVATPPDHEQRIHYSSLLIATRRLASWLARGRPLHPPDV